MAGQTEKSVALLLWANSQSTIVSSLQLEGCPKLLVACLPFDDVAARGQESAGLRAASAQYGMFFAVFDFPENVTIA
jgi:hypothetical protein